MDAAMMRDACARSIMAAVRKLSREYHNKEFINFLLSAPDAIRARSPFEPLCAVDIFEQHDTNSMRSKTWMRFIAQCGYDFGTSLSLYKNFMFSIYGQPFDFHACKLASRQQLQQIFGKMFGNLIADCIATPADNPIMAALFSREFDSIIAPTYAGLSIAFDCTVTTAHPFRLPSVFGEVFRHDQPVNKMTAAAYFNKHTGCVLDQEHDISAYRNDYYEIVSQYRPEDLREVEAALEAGQELPVLREGEMYPL